MTDETAISLYRKDARFHAIVSSAVAEAMNEFRDQIRDIEADGAERAVHEVATLACIVALKRAFDGDAELAAARAERDVYKDHALKMANLAPQPVFVPKRP